MVFEGVFEQGYSRISITGLLGRGAARSVRAMMLAACEQLLCVPYNVQAGQTDRNRELVHECQRSVVRYHILLEQIRLRGPDDGYHTCFVGFGRVPSRPFPSTVRRKGRNDFGFRPDQLFEPRVHRDTERQLHDPFRTRRFGHDYSTRLGSLRHFCVLQSLRNERNCGLG
jgi:hypothetical protein